MESFVDQVSLRVVAGKGGDGSRSMRREIYVPRGGPDGGDGGKGGSVIFVADEHMRTLADLAREREYRAAEGKNGYKQMSSGRSGLDRILKVPVGTLVRDAKSNEMLADLIEKGQRFTAAKGGRGGRGNVHFKSSTRQAPTLAEKGEPGESRMLKLELKMLADAALVGFPNAGKSTLLSVVSKAHPKIGDYPFTTVVPQLGVVDLGEDRSFILADLPGLIEGAAEGKGLGHRFLKHIERTRVLLFLLDGAKEKGLWDDYQTLKKELKAYHAGLARLPRMAAVTKADLPSARKAFKDLKARFARDKTKLYLVSGAAQEGTHALMAELEKRVRLAPPSLLARESEKAATEKVYRPAPRFELRVEDGVFVLEGKEVRKWVAMTDFNNDEALDRLKRILERMGVEKALRQAGAREGDTVRVGRDEFAYAP